MSLKTKDSYEKCMFSMEFVMTLSILKESCNFNRGCKIETAGLNTTKMMKIKSIGIEELQKNCCFLSCEGRNSVENRAWKIRNTIYVILNFTALDFFLLKMISKKSCSLPFFLNTYPIVETNYKEKFITEILSKEISFYFICPTYDL